MRYFILILTLILTSTSLVSAQEQTPYDIALERILEAEASGTTELDLSGLGLTELPPEIGNLSNLETLNLSFNELSSLPPEIGNLANLIGLFLYKNELISLPSEIGNLTNLTAMNLGRNELRSLPSEIGNLTNLTGIYLGINELSSLPPEIGNLINLCLLGVDGNQIQYLPASLAKITRLESQHCRFYFENNPLISPPAEVIDQGTSAIFDYLENRALWHFQRLMLSVLGGVGLIVLVILGLRYRQRSQRKPKQKRGNVS